MKEDIQSLKTKYTIFRSNEPEQQSPTKHLELLNSFKKILIDLEKENDNETIISIKNWLQAKNIYDLDRAILEESEKS